jgi:DNA-binding NtrC family response regulator
LRERREDIPLLLGHFIDWGDDVMRAMMSYDWPGNVRELKHCVDRMAALRSESALQTADSQQLCEITPALVPCLLADVLQQHPFREFVHSGLSPVISIPDREQQAIRNKLAQTRAERRRAASWLRIGRTTRYRKMKQYGIE